MLYREIIAVCSEIHTKHINTVCGQNVELLNVKLAVHTSPASYTTAKVVNHQDQFDASGLITVCAYFTFIPGVTKSQKLLYSKLN